MGQADRAEADFTRAHEISKDLVQAHPAEATYRADLAQNHHSRGLVFRGRKPPDQAVAELARSRDLWKELVSEYPAVNVYRAGLANVHLNLGVFYFENQHQPKESEQELRRSLALWEELARADPGYPEFQSKQAYVHNNLGILYTRLRRFPEAGASYQKALAIREKLVRTHPTVNDYQSKLGKSHHNLGDWYQRTGRRAEAEAAYRKGLAIHKVLAEAHPRVTTYLVDLGQSYGRLGHLKKHTDPRDALKWLDLACQTHQATLRIEPNHWLARECLGPVHEGRATAWTHLGHHKEALQEWDQALAQGTGPYRDWWRMRRAQTLVRLGERSRALDEGKAVTSRQAVSGDVLYEAAGVYSLCAAAVTEDIRLPAVDRAKLAEQYAVVAVELLRRAGAGGYFRFPANRARLRQEAIFAPVRSRPDFQKLIAGLEKAGEARP
jgi:tetratricopeptide (TPR) repeat protein